jgi:hypothetical protein
VRRATLLTLVGGLALIATYALCRAFEIGEIGAPTDIGGGFILLAGYACTGIGVALAVGDFLEYRRGRRS